MELFLITIVAFFASILTFFSGFGLGTILVPIFIVFYPVDLAIALTGVVHFFSSLTRAVFIGKEADKEVLIYFGIPAIIAAIAGSYLLLNIMDLKPLFHYGVGSRIFFVYPVKFIVSVLLLFFAIFELIPSTKNISFKKNKLPIGGALSGFFGGLSGNQGALRSAFLIKAGLSKEAYVATAAVISCFVDFTRLSVYATRFTNAGLQANPFIVIIPTIAAITGTYVGNKLIKKITLNFIRITVAILLIVISLALGAGLI